MFASERSIKKVWRIYIMLFSSLSAFLSVFAPLAVLIFFGIIFEDRLVEIEQRIFKRIRKQLSSKKRKNAAPAKRTAAVKAAGQKRGQFRRAA